MALLKALTPANVVATAGRPESRAWLRSIGVAHIVDRSGPLGADNAYDSVFSTTGSGEHWAKYPTIIKPFGDLCVIDDPGELSISGFKLKAQSIHWELVFTKSRFDVDAASQGHILAEVARLVDAGALRTTVGTTLRGLTVDNLTQAHAILESGTAVGKVVIPR